MFTMTGPAAVRSSHFTVKLYGLRLVLIIALVKREVIERLGKPNDLFAFVSSRLSPVFFTPSLSVVYFQD